MEILHTEEGLQQYMSTDVIVESEHPVIIDHFANNATEIDEDAVADMLDNVLVGGIMEHIEAAGSHSGESVCSLPTISVPYNAMAAVRAWTIALAKQLSAVGLMNV